MSAPADVGDELGRGEPLDGACLADSAAVTLDDVSTHDLFCCSAFDKHVGPDCPQDQMRRWVIEDEYVIDAGERSKHLHSPVLLDDWSSWTFQLSDRLITVDGNKQSVS